MSTNQNNAAVVTETAAQAGVSHAIDTVNGHGGGISAAFLKLAAEFPKSQVRWRAQSVSSKDPENPKALALAYIDARDVMQRLDDAFGPENWQSRYSHADKKTVCEIGIRVGSEWVWKANGAGDSDIEAEKGALSDAFKRAAVLWGVGRYLYDIESPWVPCKLYNGKWSEWKADPWSCIRGNHAPSKPLPIAAKPASKPSMTPLEAYESYKQKITAATTEVELRKWVDTDKYRRVLAALDGAPEKAALMNLVTEKFTKFHDLNSQKA